MKQRCSAIATYCLPLVSKRGLRGKPSTAHQEAAAGIRTFLKSLVLFLDITCIPIQSNIVMWISSCELLIFLEASIHLYKKAQECVCYVFVIRRLHHALDSPTKDNQSNGQQRTRRPRTTSQEPSRRRMHNQRPTNKWREQWGQDRLNPCNKVFAGRYTTWGPNPGRVSTGSARRRCTTTHSDAIPVLAHRNGRRGLLIIAFPA